jgi:uncharacterized protein (TIGR03545 family)
MRTKAILIVIGFLIIIGIIGFIWGDSMMTWALEGSLQAIIGAKVDVEGFHLNPFKMAIQIDSIQMTNPADTWKNIIDTKKISFKLAPEPLFEGKTVIDELIVEDLTFNTPRQTDGKLKKSALPGPFGKAQTKLHQNIAQMPFLKPETITKNLDTEKITASYQFKTDLSAGRIKSELTAYQNKWEMELNDLKNVKVELKSWDNKITQIKSLNSKNLLELKKQLDLIKQIQSSVKQIRAEIRTTDEQFKMDNQELEKAIKGLKHEAEADYQALLALAKLPDIGNINYTEALLGKTMLNASTTFLKLADELQRSLPVNMEHPPKEEQRRGGQEISFPGRKSYPRFLIKKIAISGKGTPDSFTDGFYAKGVLTGITSEPPIYGMPIIASILAAAPNGAFLELDGQINHITPAFNDLITVKLKNLPLPRIDFGDSRYLPSKIISGKAEIDATMQITPGAMKLKALLTGANIKSDYTGKSETDDLISGIVRNTLANLNQVKVNYQLELIEDRLEMKLSSNLDQIISSRLKEAVGEKIAGFTSELRAKVEAKLLKEEAALKREKQKYQNEVANKLAEVQMELKLKEQELEAKKKELEAKVRQALG